MSGEQNVLLPVWVYVQACCWTHRIDGRVEIEDIKFRHIKVAAPDENNAYTLGQRALPVQGWIEHNGTINDYVIPIYEQAFTLEGSVQTTDRSVLKLRPKTSTSEPGIS